MEHELDDDAEYMADEHEVEDVDSNMSDDLHGRDNGGSDSDVDEYDRMVCHLCYILQMKHAICKLRKRPSIMSS